MNASVSSWRQPPGATASAPKWAASRAQSHQPDFARRGREDDEIEERHKLLAQPVTDPLSTQSRRGRNISRIRRRRREAGRVVW